MKSGSVAAGAVLLGSLLLSGTVRAGGASAGLAGAFSLRARGVEAPSWNPATLAWSDALTVGIVSLDAGAHNNAYSLGDYRRWNGAVLDEEDEDTILARIPGSFLRGGFSVETEGPGFAWRGWAVTTSSHAAGAAAVPKEYGRLLFYGNDPQESYDLDGTGGEAAAWSELRWSHGREVGAVRIGRDLLRLAVGGSVKWLQGWAQGEVTHAEGSLVTSTQGISGVQELVMRSAQGGSGYACDLGVVGRTETWSFGLSLRNPLSQLSWTRETEEHTERAWADTLTLEDLEGEESADLVDTESSSRSIDSFSGRLPGELTIAAARDWRGFRCEADLRQGFRSRLGSSTTPRLAVGVSCRPWRAVEGRAGLAVGGTDGPMVAAGLGLTLWRIRWDLGVATRRGVDFTSPRGVEAGLSLGLWWDGDRE